MKNAFFIFFLFFTSISLFAQVEIENTDNQSIINQKNEEDSSSKFKLGPFFQANFSKVISSINPCNQNDYQFDYTLTNFGASVQYLFLEEFGILLNISKNSIASKAKTIKVVGEESPTPDNLYQYITLDYLNLMPAIYYREFYLGFNIAINIAGVKEYSNEYLEWRPRTENKVGFDRNEIYDLRGVSMGGMIPIYETSGGELNLILQASYDWYSDDNMDGDIITFSLGFNYLFNIRL